MRILMTAALALGLAGAAAAQTTGHTSTTRTATSAGVQAGGGMSTGVGDHGNPALKDPTVAKTGVMAGGANSFTEGQARTRITKAGYSRVGKLTKGADGVWMGSAMKGRKHVQVGLDFQGNVTTR